MSKLEDTSKKKKEKTEVLLSGEGERAVDLGSVISGSDKLAVFVILGHEPSDELWVRDLAITITIIHLHAK